jgi:hypothetical protein
LNKYSAISHKELRRDEKLIKEQKKKLENMDLKYKHEQQENENKKEIIEGLKEQYSNIEVEFNLLKENNDLLREKVNESKTLQRKIKLKMENMDNIIKYESSYLRG